MKIKHADNNIQFLAGAGEMGKLTREKDWSTTSLGPSQFWPQSLRTALSIILNSKFPMFLWWGPELLCFYNDAYRPSLGQNGKHPFILGMKAEEAWTEIWHIIKPLIDQVLAGGEATWSEDQLIPIYRNGKIEDVYWTFSYSPVKDEEGEIGGVLVTCSETTEKIRTLSQLEESKNELEFAIKAAGLGTFDYNPLTNKFSANDMLKEWFGLGAGEHIELTHAVNAIPDSDRQRVTDAIQKALDFSSGGNYDIEYTILHPVSKKEIIVHAKGRAWFNDEKIAYRFNGTLEDITEQATAAKKIMESETRYDHLIYSSPSAIGILYGEDLIITIANDAIIEIFGKGKEIIGKPYFEALPELAAQGYKDVFAKVFKTGIPFNAVETPVNILQNGVMTLRYYNFLLYPQRDIKNKIEGIGIIATEVTSQALLNKQMQESEKRFRLLADSMPQFIWTSDPEGNLNYFNQSVFDYSGLSPDQINKEGWIQIVHPEDREKNIEQWLHSIRTGKEFFLEHRFRKYTGEYRWQLSRAVPQKEESGKIQMWVGTSTDIEEQKTFAQELEQKVAERTAAFKQSEEKFNTLFHLAPYSASLTETPSGKTIMVNEYFIKTFGYTREDIIGKSSVEVDMLSPQMRAEILSEIKLHGNLKNKEIEFISKSGEKIPTLTSSVLIKIGGEKFYLGAYNDIRERKKVEEEIAQKNNDLEKMNKELQSFAYISSHDLQEPLRKIQTFSTQLLEKEFHNLSDSGRDKFRRMQNTALRMQTLIEDLLAYSRTNISEKKFEKTDLKKIVEEVTADLKEELQEKHATIEATEMCEANIIVFQFRQLLQNLIGNSLKFSKPDRPPHIIIKSKIASGRELNNDKLFPQITYCHISISDNSIGFEQKFSDKIFELFQQLHAKTEYNGTGIGLAIVKKIVENHDGIITATGELNKGATFDIYLPAD